MRVAVVVASLLAAVSAKNIIITVGGNTTTNGSLVFQPQEVHAELGDAVIFNFTLGNHTATESSFAQPCTPINESITPMNGFDSNFRLAGNGSNPSILPVPILIQNVNTTFWFYDVNTCGEGGVGVINANDSSTETLAGFVRNAIRLNGTNATSSSAAPSSTGGSVSGSSTSSSSSSANPSTTSSAAQRGVVLGGLGVLPMVLAALVL
ncbi:hypothetical protein OBBRIDRAFT_793143 [Obba rivulosa]|uniref:Extracellular serine-rich protein n=1 Tax=Obba rivulosa TaxID=1052685 RepID=A0A8E2AWR5_9APHY|nr:hypothetical protein OBBRIDRAFT_793143 [Obba rivulosa]